MDHRELLKKYVMQVMHNEGSYCLPPRIYPGGHLASSDFTDEEARELEQIVREIDPSWQDPADPASSVYAAAYGAVWKTPK